MRGSVLGCVVRADNGALVPNAKIEVVRGPGVVRGPASSPGPVVSGDGGGFVLSGLSEGEWVLSALSSAGRGQARVYAFDNASSEVTIEIAEVPGGVARGGGVGQTKKTERGATGSLRGRVVHISTGKPVADAAISVVRGAGPVPDIAPLSDSGGWFALDGLPAGDWLLRALGPSGETGEATVCVSAGRVAEMVIKTGA